MAGQYVSSQAISDLLRATYKNKKKLEVVFVNSCHSELIGRVFQRAGAKHVVCVKKEFAIRDDVCNLFAAYFYKAIFSSKQTVCEAFSLAKKQLEVQGHWNGEENKFVMLCHDENRILEDHKCVTFLKNSKSNPQKLIDFSVKPHFTKVPFRSETFLGRNLDIHNVLTLFNQSKFVLIKGKIGMGKSSLVQAMANMVLEKGIYRDGVIFND